MTGMLYISQVYFFYFFLIIAHLWLVGVLRSWVRFLGLEFSVNGALSLWNGAFSDFLELGLSI